MFQFSDEKLTLQFPKYATCTYAQVCTSGIPHHLPQAMNTSADIPLAQILMFNCYSVNKLWIPSDCQHVGVSQTRDPKNEWFTTKNDSYYKG